MRPWMVFVASMVLGGALAVLLWRRSARVGRWLPRVALGVVLALGLISGYIAWREYRALDELAAVIEPFPGIERALYVPTRGPGVSTWMFRASASPGEVQRFYQDERHRRGWTVRQNSGLFIVMERQDQSLDLSIQPDSPGRLLLVYALTRQARP